MHVVTAKLRPPTTSAQAALIATDGPMLIARIDSFWLEMILLAMPIFARGRRRSAVLLSAVIGQAVDVSMIGLKNASPPMSPFLFLLSVGGI